ncbi:hypothetical protein E3J61_00555 [Candidatus Dependentiae bacterium]|nr:MAG: hypothetical protein E3J61_00555 [Candidatus Dependentiae bacterium]
MIINRKILLYSLLAGLAFGASRSWPMEADWPSVTELFSSSSNKPAAPGKILVTIGIFTAGTYGTYRLIKYVYDKRKQKLASKPKENKCGPECKDLDPFSLEDKTPFRLDDLSIATADQTPVSA